VFGESLESDCCLCGVVFDSNLIVVVAWEAGGDRKTIAQSERKHNTFLVLYDVKQVQAAEVSQRRTAVSSKCFQLYYTCSDC
jgi:hypothetical protein